MAGKPKLVVATGPGHYGNTMRYVGERFAISDEAHFSKRWMIYADDPTRADELAALERDFRQYSRTSRTAQDVTDQQLLSEIAEAGGVSAMLTEENRQLKASVAKLTRRISELEDQLEALSKEAGYAGDPDEDQTNFDIEAGAAAGEDGSADGDAAGDAAEAGQAADVPAGRPTRRTRRG